MCRRYCLLIWFVPYDDTLAKNGGYLYETVHCVTSVDRNQKAYIVQCTCHVMSTQEMYYVNRISAYPERLLWQQAERWMHHEWYPTVLQECCATGGAWVNDHQMDTVIVIVHEDFELGISRTRSIGYSYSCTGLLPQAIEASSDSTHPLLVEPER